MSEQIASRLADPAYTRFQVRGRSEAARARGQDEEPLLDSTRTHQLSVGPRRTWMRADLRRGKILADPRSGQARDQPQQSVGPNEEDRCDHEARVA